VVRRLPDAVPAAVPPAGVEYELAATVTATGVSAAATFIGVLTVREGRISCWREYQNPLAIAWALRTAAS
jgi:ketosteroid isomerase-like protein